MNPPTQDILSFVAPNGRSFLAGRDKNPQAPSIYEILEIGRTDKTVADACALVDQAVDFTGQKLVAGVPLELNTLFGRMTVARQFGIRLLGMVCFF